MKWPRARVLLLAMTALGCLRCSTGKGGPPAQDGPFRQPPDILRTDLPEPPDNPRADGPVSETSEPDGPIPDTTPPDPIGCSDGQRDGFTNAAQFPAIAGCKAGWKQSSMIAPRTNKPCGNQLSVVCDVPADACAKGWHVCGGPPHGPADITSKITQAQCAAEPGEYVAGLGDQDCACLTGGGYGAVCCGDACVQQNGNCVWPGKTAWMGVINNHINACGDAINSSPDLIGVLCCAD